MKFEVELIMFQKGTIRVVDVPDQALTGELIHDLDQIFYYGQNDVQPNPKRVSVSAGDVVRYHGTRYLINTVGFNKLNNGGTLSSDPIKRIKQLYGGKDKK
jgi:hypothetical protein